MVENEKSLKNLKDKVADYKRFGFILLSLSVFLFIGMIVPSEGVGETQLMMLVLLSVGSILLSVYFHRKAMKYQEQLYKEEI